MSDQLRSSPTHDIRCAGARLKTTRYFEEQVLPKRAYLQREWCERVLANPAATVVQEDGRVRRWAAIAELDGRYLRVVTLEDGETVLNAFPDRGFVLPQSSEEEK